MISEIIQYYLYSLKPKIVGWITKCIYSRHNVRFGKGLTCDQIPRIFVDKNAQLLIEENVQFRKGVEIRVHGDSKMNIGSRVKIDRGVRLLSANKAVLSVGNRTAIGLYSVFNGGDDITLGEACLISGFVYLQTSMHSHKKGAFIKDQGYSHSPVTLGDDVWLGAHAVVLPGCKLDNGAVVGSNAVVTKSVESNVISAGVPAKLIGTRE